MFNNVALDVVIGLIFIYMLYSLLATVLSEIIATLIGLRARNLKEAVNRMLNDEDGKTFLKRLLDSLNLMKDPKNPIIQNFYNHPEIKYLGSSGIFKNPSSFKSISFSKTLLNVLFGIQSLTPRILSERLEEIMQLSSQKDKKVLDPDTAQYIYTLWIDSYGDIVSFKFQLESWFDRTMEQATEWYKRKIQVILLTLGFFMAWAFNADTFVIVDKLSNDKDAREKMVDMASAYLKENKTVIDTSRIQNETELKIYSQRLDSLLKIKKELDADIARANTTLGLGSWPPDVVNVTYDKKSNAKILTPPLDHDAIPANVLAADGDSPSTLEFSTRQKWSYFFNLLPLHFFGFLMTAIAISLGAPFWFDVLNKLMKLRTSVKQDTESPRNSADEREVSRSGRGG